MPAPVSATTEPCLAHEAGEELDAAVYRPRHVGWRLPRKAPMPSRASSLAKTRGEAGLLGLDALVEVRACRDLLDRADGQRRLPGELARPRQRGVDELVVEDHAVDEAEDVGLLGADGVAHEVHLQRLVLAHEPRKALRPAEAGDDPELDLGLAEERRLRRDAHVAGHGQLAAAAEGETVDRGDGDDARAREAAQQIVRGLQQLAPAGLVHRGEGLDVGAGREEQRVRGGDDQRAHARAPRPSPIPRAGRRSPAGRSSSSGRCRATRWRRRRASRA